MLRCFPCFNINGDDCEAQDLSADGDCSSRCSEYVIIVYVEFVVYLLDLLYLCIHICVCARKY